MLRRSCIILGLFFLLLLSACQGLDNQEALPTQENTSLSLMPTRTETTIPSSTATAVHTSTSTPAPTATKHATATPTPTITPTLFLGFERAQVYKALAYMDETLFYFIVPGVAAPYYGTVDGFPLSCEVDPDGENLLICRAEEDLFGTDVKSFVFYADEEKTSLVYRGDFSTTLNVLPPTPTPAGFIWPRANFTSADITWAMNSPDCPVRGINLSCEIEYRTYDDGSCLVGMTCADSCGFYYSVDTIKDKQGEWIGVGPCW